MRAIMVVTLTAASLALAACGGKGDDKLGEQAQEALENRADAMDVAADNMSGPAADSMEVRADAMRDAGNAKEERIDDADLNVDAMSGVEKKEVVKP